MITMLSNHPESPRLRRLLLCLSIIGLNQWAVAQNPTAHDTELYDAYTQHAESSRGASQVTLSPDGKTLGWTGPSLDGKTGNGMWLMPMDGGTPTQIKAAGQENGMAWSPDGSTISIVSGRGRQAQIYITSRNGGEARKLTSFNGQIGRREWSPDGKSIAFLAIENPKRVSGATQPFKPETGLVGSKPDVQRLAIVDVATGDQRWASPADMYVYEFGWSPSGTEIAVTAALPPGENNWWTAKLYAANVATGKLRLVTTPELQINTPKWSPDGKSIAYIGGIMSDFGSIGGDIWLVPASGGAAKNFTNGHKGSANSFNWMHDGSIVIGETVEGETAFTLLNVQTGKLQQLERQAASFSGAEGRSSVALSKDARFEAYASATLTHGTEIFAGPVGKVKQITHWNDNAVAYWGRIKSIHWKSDRFDVQGWLVAPLKVEAEKKYPMIVQVHGGPAAGVSGSWGTGQGASFWSQAGYFVFMPNPRGSFGEGEEFTKANRKDFGYGDLRDVMAGVDKILATEPVDGSRLGLTGGSYGGFMTMWGVTQTNRFKAAVAVAGIANWKSYYGENSIDEWMIPYFGATVYDDPKVYAKSSPIEFIKNVKTPTLIAVGEFDGECPPPQSYEFWHALQVLKVPSELLVYPGEGHGVRQPENRRDLMTRELAWFNYYLK
jgi:dipeptidyl aminopeptidase/acylaminoacyl peptidase